MNVFTNTIFVIVSLSIVVIYCSYIILLCTLGKYLINKRSRCEFLIPVVALVISLSLFLSVGKNAMEFEKIDQLYVSDGSKNIGKVYYIADASNVLLHLGQLVLFENDKALYLNVDINKNVISVDKPNSNISNILESSLKRNKINYKNFIGKSETYGELSHHKIPKKNRTTFVIILLQGIIIFLPPVISIAIYLSSRYKRKKKNMLIKMKLNDL